MSWALAALSFALLAALVIVMPSCGECGRPKRRRVTTQGDVENYCPRCEAKHE